MRRRQPPFQPKSEPSDLRRFEQLYRRIGNAILTDPEINQLVHPLQARQASADWRHPFSSERLGKDPDPNLVGDIAVLLTEYSRYCQVHGIELDLRLSSKPLKSDIVLPDLKFREWEFVSIGGAKLILQVPTAVPTASPVEHIPEMSHPAAMNWRDAARAFLTLTERTSEPWALGRALNRP